MNVLNATISVNNALNERDLLKDMYEAFRTLDMSGSVMSLLRALRNTNTLPRITKSKKSSDESCRCRHAGNACYREQQYWNALRYYNRALLWAPKNTIHLALAYNDRSALLMELKEFNASHKDIETCFKLQCTDTDLLRMLTARKEECEKLIWEENQMKSASKNLFTREFFKVRGKTHLEIPCLSTSVNIVTESGQMKAVAVKDIPVGTVLAVETAFTTFCNDDLSNVTCHYCQKLSYNLLPCDNCCYALFCSKKCKKLCISEYHLIECQIMDILMTVSAGGRVGGSRFQLAIKTALKLKTLCKQWSTLIKESQNIGTNRLKTSSMDEIYNSKNYASILSFNDDQRHFIHGALYNSCVRNAIVIHHLQDISGFFPEERKSCLEAQKCLAKLFTTLELMWPSSIEIGNFAAELNEDHINVPFYYGWFPFTSKLKHSCDPNVMVLGLDNQVGLVAVQPIKKTKELKISYIRHWALCTNERNQRIEKIYRNIFNVCSCHICKEDWSPYNATEGIFNRFQKCTFSHWKKLHKKISGSLDEAYFRETCKTLTVLGKQPHTVEYCAVFMSLYLQLELLSISVQ